MSEHRRKPQQPQSGGRAAARKAAQQRPGRGAGAGRDVPTSSPSGPYQEQPGHGSRADARRSTGRGSAGRGAAGAGRGNGRPDKRFINYPRSDKAGWKRFVPSWKLVSGTALGFFAIIIAGAGIGIASVNTPMRTRRPRPRTTSSTGPTTPRWSRPADP